MSQLARLCFSLEQPLLDKLEDLMRNSTYANRSEFIRDMIRERLVHEEWTSDGQALGTITLIYDHHTRGLTDRLTELQHRYHAGVLASTHVHLTHELCAEMIMVSGKAAEVSELAGLLRQQKGVLHAALSMSTPGVHLA